MDATLHGSATVESEGGMLHRQNANQTRRFSNMQWYLAQSRVTVFFAAYLENSFSKKQLEAMVTAFSTGAPQLLMRECLSQDRHIAASPETHSAIVQFKQQDRLKVHPTNWFLPRFDLYADHDWPAFKAWGVAAREPDERRRRGFVLMQSTHALMEGADLAAILHGRPAYHAAADSTGTEMGWPHRLLISAVTPAVSLIHLMMAKTERRSRNDFRFRSLSISSARLRQCARELGVSRRALLFSAILHGMADKPGAKQTFGYSSLPAKPLQLDTDNYLRVRMHQLTVRSVASLAANTRALADRLDAADGQAIATQVLLNNALRFQRRLIRILPSLYRGPFFGYGPSDIVLSILPPIRPRGIFEPLRHEPVFGGSATGTIPNCIVLPGEFHTTLNFWADEKIRDAIPAIMDRLKSLKLEPDNWMDGA